MMYVIIVCGIIVMIVKMIQEQKRKHEERHPTMTEVPRDAEERLVKTSRDLIRKRYNRIFPPKRLKLSGDKLIPGRKVGFLFAIEPLVDEWRIFWKRSRWLPGKLSTACLFPEEITDLNGSEVVLEGRGFEGVGNYNRYLVPCEGTRNPEEIAERHVYSGRLKYEKQLHADLWMDLDWATKRSIRGDPGLALIELEKRGEIPTVEARRIKEEQRRRTLPQSSPSESELDTGGA